MCFEEIVKRITPALKRLTKYLNGHFSFFDDEDLFQEACLNLWQRYKDGQLEGKNDAYILRGSSFHLKNYLRKARDKGIYISMEEPIDENGTTILELIPDKSPAPDRCVDTKLFIEKVKEDGLSRREKEVFNLCLKGLTVREIGNILGISHVRVVKLKKNIKNKYSSEWDDAKS